MSEDTLLEQLIELGLAAAPARLKEIAREKGAASLELLRAALEVPDLAEAAVEALGEVPAQEAWDLLEREARGGGGTKLRKHARRAQHRLRSRGFRPLTAAREQAHPVVEQARASFFDFRGAQMFHVVVPAPLGLVRYVGFMIFPEGLADCVSLLTDRAGLEEFLALEDERTGEVMVEMGLAYVTRRVRQAVERSRESRSPLPEEYLDAARVLQDAPADEEPEELAAVPVTPEVSLGEAYELLRHRSMLRWPLPPKQMSPYVDRWMRLAEHQPVRTEEGLTNLGAVQVLGRMAAEIIADLFDEEARRRFVVQLREQARMLHVMGEKRLAGISLRAAAGLEQHPVAEAPFLRALIDISMDDAIREAQEEKEERGPWVSRETQSGRLWVPRPPAGDEEEDRPPSSLWLPGQ